MAYEDKSFIDLIAWRPENGTIEVRRSDVVYKDGVELVRQYHRHVVGPKDDVTQEDDLVKKIATLFATERAAAKPWDAEDAPGNKDGHLRAL